MRCPRCGDTIEDSDRFCSSCGQDLATYRRLWPGDHAALQPVPEHAPIPPEAPTRYVSGAMTAGIATSASAALERIDEVPRIPTYLGWASALAAICWPAIWAAIPALKYAGRAESLIDKGDMVAAQEAALKAKTWCWVTFGAGLVLWAVALTLVVTL